MVPQALEPGLCRSVPDPRVRFEEENPVMAVLAAWRGRRVERLLAHLRRGGLEALPEFQHETRGYAPGEVAAALREALPAAEMRRRLRRLGLRGRWCAGDLRAVGL